MHTKGRYKKDAYIPQSRFPLRNRVLGEKLIDRDMRDAQVVVRAGVA